MRWFYIALALGALGFSAAGAEAQYRSDVPNSIQRETAKQALLLAPIYPPRTVGDHVALGALAGGGGGLLFALVLGLACTCTDEMGLIAGLSTGFGVVTGGVAGLAVALVRGAPPE